MKPSTNPNIVSYLDQLLNYNLITQRIFAIQLYSPPQKNSSIIFGQESLSGIDETQMKIARLPNANDWTLLIFNSSYGNTKFFTGKTSYNISINPAVPVIIFPSNDFVALNSIIVKNLTKSQYGQLGSTQKSVIYMSCADLMSQN